MIKEKSFDCGLRLVVNENKTDYVSFGIGINCGSSKEKENEFGLAHFNEHLFFKSTKTKTTEQLANELEFYGAQINAFTDFEKTYYYFKVIKENFKQCFELYADMFFNGKYNKKEVDMERKVVLEEIKMYQDDSVSNLFEESEEIFFNGTPFSHNVIGNSKIIETAPIKLIKQFKEKNYTANNITIVASGGIKFRELKKLVKQFFVSHFTTKSKANLCNQTAYPSNVLKNYHIIQKEDKQVHLSVFIKGETFFSPSYYTQKLYASMMGSGLSGRMFLYLREKQGLAYSTRIYRTIQSGSAYLAFYIGTNSEKIKDCIVGIKYLLTQAAQKGFSEKELEKAKTTFKSKLIFNNSNSNKNMTNLNQMLTYGKLTDRKEIFKKIEAISLSDVNNFAKQIANENQFLVAASGNKIDLEVLKLFEK